MKYEDHWEKVGSEPLGRGGQGTVFLVRRRHESLADTRKVIIESVGSMTRASIPRSGFREDACDQFVESLERLRERNDPCNLAALKLLHEPGDGRDPVNAKQRIQREMAAMSKVSHPSLVARTRDGPGGKVVRVRLLSKRLPGRVSDYVCRRPSSRR